MKVIIRRERYDVFDEDKIWADYRGPVPHVMMYNGFYWQRMIVHGTDAEKVVSILRINLRKGRQSVNLNKTAGIPVTLPKFKVKFLPEEEG